MKSDETSTPSSSISSRSSSHVVSTSSVGAANGGRKALNGWIEEVWVLVLVAGLAH